MATKVKICGITRIEDALAAQSLGADALGFVFYAPSPRNVSMDVAAEISSQLSPFTTRVGLFVNPEKDFVEEVLAKVDLDLLQFHGDEDDGFCASFGRPHMKARRVESLEDVHEAWRSHPRARAILFDAKIEGLYGGTGASFDWKILKESSSQLKARPWVLAGGLNPGNIGEAIRITGAESVDVSGGVESSKGVKDHAKMAEFIANAKKA